MIEPWRELEALIAADPVKGAYFSQREARFRMALWRFWDTSRPALAVMGLNPSTASATKEDMTSTKIQGFADRNGYGGYILGNLYSYCATDPMELLRVGTRNAEGYGNKEWVKAIVGGRDTLVAWGVCDLDREYLLDMENLIVSHAASMRVFCLGYTAGGFPRHPSRLAYDTPFEEWQPARRPK